jgi:hypothetical protein
MLVDGQRIKEFTKIYFDEYNSEISKLKRSRYSEHEKFCWDLFDKIVENFSSMGELLILSEKENMTFLKNSIYILLRSGLSDCIIFLWLHQEKDNKPFCDEERKIKVESLLKDHIKHHILHMQKLESLGHLSPEDKKFDIDTLNKQYIHLLDAPIKNDLITNIKSSIPVRSMVDKDNPLMISAYTIYGIFSKIEHPGVFTRMILETSHKEGINPMDQYIDHSVHMISAVIKVYAHIFFEDPAFIKKISEFKLLK